MSLALSMCVKLKVAHHPRKATEIIRDEMEYSSRGEKWAGGGASSSIAVVGLKYHGVAFFVLNDHCDCYIVDFHRN